MKNGRTSMENSILTTLSSIHATVLSILLGALLVYFFFSYQKVSELKELLNDMRLDISQIITTPNKTIIIKKRVLNFNDFTKNDTIDFRKIRDELSNLKLLKIPDDIRKELEKSGVISSQKDEVIAIGDRLLDIINILSKSYPYSTTMRDDKLSNNKVKHASKEYDEVWKINLIYNNSYLSWFWRVQKDEILKILTVYNEIFYEEELKSIKESNQKFKKNAPKSINTEMYSNMLQTLKIDFKFIVEDFFKRVNTIEIDYIPQIKETSNKLDFYLSKFNIKKYLTITFISSFIILIIGVFLPLFIRLYSNHPHLKEIELGLLLFTTLFYCSIVLYFLKKALELKFN